MIFLVDIPRARLVVAAGIGHIRRRKRVALQKPEGSERIGTDAANHVGALRRRTRIEQRTAAERGGIAEGRSGGRLARRERRHDLLRRQRQRVVVADSQAVGAGDAERIRRVGVGRIGTEDQRHQTGRRARFLSGGRIGGAVVKDLRRVEQDVVGTGRGALGPNQLVERRVLRRRRIERIILVEVNVDFLRELLELAGVRTRGDPRDRLRYDGDDLRAFVKRETLDEVLAAVKRSAR